MARRASRRDARIVFSINIDFRTNSNISLQRDDSSNIGPPAGTNNPNQSSQANSNSNIRQPENTASTNCHAGSNLNTVNRPNMEPPRRKYVRKIRNLTAEELQKLNQKRARGGPIWGEFDYESDSS